MKTLVLLRSTILTAAAAIVVFAAAGCGTPFDRQGNNKMVVAGHSGPGGAGSTSSGVGVGGHEPTTAPSSGVGPSGAGPAGSQ